MFSNLWPPGTPEDNVAETNPLGAAIAAKQGQPGPEVGSKRQAPPQTKDAKGNSSWSLLAAWGAEENNGDGAPRQSPRKVPALTISALPHPTKVAVSPTKPLSESARSAAGRRPTSAAPSGSKGSIVSSGGGTGGVDEHARPRASPGAILRMQSSSTNPAPHPLPELMRLTAGRHLVPMSRIIHSMASLSRAGREQNRRKTNQDSCFAFRQYVQPYQAIAGVLDGHGPNGHLVSGFIKSQLPVAVADHLKRKGEVPAAAALTASFLETQAGLRAASATINARLSGSTAVVTLIQGRRLTTAWVGDSRAALVRREVGGGWRGVALTQDHKPNSAGELSRILASGGRVERLSDGMGRQVGPQRVWLPGAWVPGLAMSRAMGDFVAGTVGVIADPEVHCCELETGDQFLIVASDGVWEFMSVQEAAELVGGCETAEDACRKLVDAATEKWCGINEGVIDDISAVVAKFFPIKDLP